MRTVTALTGQTVFDIALLYCGDAVRAWDIALENGVDLTSVFESSTDLLIPESSVDVSAVAVASVIEVKDVVSSRKVRAVAGQCLFDIAMLYCGDVSLAWEIARENGISVTKTFEQNTTLTIPTERTNTAVIFENEGTNFATGSFDYYWLLSSGYWDDDGIWFDAEVWID